MNSCDEIRNLLVDNNLTEEMRSTIQEHIRTCPECEIFCRQLEKSRRDFEYLRELTPPSYLKRVFLSRIQKEKKERSGHRQFNFWQSPIGVIAASILLLFTLITLYTRVVPPLQTGEPAVFIQIYPSGKAEQTFHPPRHILRQEQGTTMTLTIHIDERGKIETILSMEGGSEELQDKYRKLLPLWFFSTPGAGEYTLIITIPQPPDQ